MDPKNVTIHFDSIGIRRMKQSGEGFECVKIGCMDIDLGRKLLLPHASKILNVTLYDIPLFPNLLIYYTCSDCTTSYYMQLDNYTVNKK